MDKKKILIVDDEKDILFTLEKALTGRGYSVISADNGKDAINLAKTASPDLVILDICMPEMDGPEVAMNLKEHPKTKDIPIIFLSSLLQKKEGAEHNSVFGGEVIIAKPYDIEELSAQIEKLVNSQTVNG